jgi:hypothetical protein
MSMGAASRRPRHTRGPDRNADPLFGPGLRLAHERQSGESGGTLATLRRLPALIALTLRLGRRADPPPPPAGSDRASPGWPS